jgi:hypothetical protein
MRRFQTIIAINFETRRGACRIAVCAEGGNSSLKDRLTINTITPGMQFRLAITLYSPLAQRFSENRTPKTSNRHAVAVSFSQERTRPPATAGLLEQRP